jgi:hypothetical protein
MKFILLLIFAFGANFSVLAQKYTSGFIVTLERDTLRGFIRDGTDAELTSGIVFRKAGSVEDFRYLPKSIYSFSFDNGRAFKQFPILQSLDREDTVVVFAKKTLEGKISIYTFSKKSQDQPDIFLVNNYSRRTIHLKAPLRKKVVEANGKTAIAESYQHVGAIRFIKRDSSSANIVNSEKFKYSENEIHRDIQKYNEQFKNDFPIATYHPRVSHFNEICAGIPVLSENEVDVDFRIAAYRHRFFPEKTETISFIQGVSYRYSYLRSAIDPSDKDSNQNFRQQFLSLIPIGINFQSDLKVCRPYIYFGGGLVFLLETNHHIVNYEDKGNVNKITVFPTLNVGAGLKIRAGANFVIMEITPTGNKSGVCINLGYSF